MFESTKQGYDNGLKDGLLDLPFNPNKGMNKLIALLSNNYVDTFLLGYRQGYREGQWENNKLRKANLKLQSKKIERKTDLTISEKISKKKNQIGQKKNEANKKIERRR